LDYVNVQEAMGGICLTIGDVQKVTSHFQKAMGIGNYAQHYSESHPGIFMI